MGFRITFEAEGPVYTELPDTPKRKRVRSNLKAEKDAVELTLKQMEWALAQAPDASDVKPIPNFPGYFISNSGVVFSTMLGRLAVLQTSLNSGGYYNVLLYEKSGLRTNQSIHRLVALTFLGEPPEGKTCCLHGDGNPRNNHVSNLRWDDQAANSADSKRHGTDSKKKLRPELVLELKKLMKQGANNQILSALFGVSESMVARIRAGIVWKHIP